MPRWKSLLPGRFFSVSAVRTRSLNGVVVTDIDENSSAYRAGLRAGDLIRAINRTKVRDVSDVEKILDGAKQGDKILLRITRVEQGFYIVFTL